MFKYRKNMKQHGNEIYKQSDHVDLPKISLGVYHDDVARPVHGIDYDRFKRNKAMQEIVYDHEPLTDLSLYDGELDYPI